MGRAPCCDKANVKRGPWSPEEDAKLKDYIDKHGTAGNWIALPQKAGLKRCGKSCRLRWLNYLRPNIKHGEFSDDEDKLICTLFANIGSRWSIIAAQLPGRTDNDIKNYWNTKLKKKLLMVHNPFNSPHQKTIRPPNNNYQFPCSSISSQMPPTFRYSGNNNINTYTTLAASRSFTSKYNENISNISSIPLNLQPQDHFLGPMQNYQGKESSFIMFGADQQAASCSSSDGSNNKDQVEYEKLMMFNGLDISSNPLDYKSLEEIKQLISTSNLSSCNSNIMNLFEDESKAAEEEKVLMYY